MVDGMTQKEKVVCTERRCGWHGTNDEMLVSPNPFEPDDTIIGCPSCKGVDTLVVACDVEGCWKESTCGFPTPEGYRRTCGVHYRELNP